MNNIIMDKLTMKDLKLVAKANYISGCSKLKKDQIIKLLKILKL